MNDKGKTSVDTKRIEKAVTEILLAVGEGDTVTTRWVLF